VCVYCCCVGVLLLGVCGACVLLLCVCGVRVLLLCVAERAWCCLVFVVCACCCFVCVPLLYFSNTRHTHKNAHGQTRTNKSSSHIRRSEEKSYECGNS